MICEVCAKAADETTYKIKHGPRGSNINSSHRKCKGCDCQHRKRDRKGQIR